ncbi:MAG TPA: Ku protein [Casimicrobiaceae bacterium]|nr:Ku protein [Casimicrobiaceae bacterium]
MPGALWKGAITFGLVGIPVELHAAEEKREFKLAMIDRRDFSPVGYKRYSKRTGKEVPWDDIVKAFEYEKGEYVVLSDEDFRRANVKASQAIEVQAFVPAEEIPVEYFETPYYLVPGRAGQKVYALLRETLRASRRVAIGEVVIRTVQHLVAVVPAGRALMLNTMRYHDQLRSAKDLDLPAEDLKSVRVTAKEAELAKRLVSDMAEHWKPEAFKDSFHQDLMRRIREKIKAGQTKEITEREREAAPRSAKVIDLAALLQRSLEEAQRAGRKGAQGRAAPARASKPAQRSRNGVAVSRTASLREARRRSPMR